MAAAVLTNRTAKWNKPKIVVDSSGTGAWHIGHSAHPMSQKVLEKAGYEYSHSAKQFQSSDFFESDLILVMDSSNYKNVIDLADSDESRAKVFYLRSFDPSLSTIDPTSAEFVNLEVPDPYNNSIKAYEMSLAMIEQAIDGLLEELRN